VIQVRNQIVQKWIVQRNSPVLFLRLREVARWRTHWVIIKRNDLPTTLCTTLDSVNPVLYPSIDTILIKLCVLLTMPIASATAEIPFSVLRRLKTYIT
jgi:hypothetical protein